jgi:hypothetical protein
MKCPVCPETTLETFSASIGSFECCPNCGGLFVHQDLVAAASQDKAKCLEALQEIKTLLLPTEKWCPKCLQKLFDGRVRSRGVILTVCSSCETLWTNLAVLGQFEETIERTLRVQIDLAREARASDGASMARGASFSSSSFRIEDRQDSGLGHFFRAFARFFDRWADRFGGRESRPVPPKAIKPKTKPEKPEKKPLIREVEPAAPAPLPPKERPVPPVPLQEPIKAVRKEPETFAGPPSIEIPEFVFPEEVSTPVPPPVERQPPEPKPEPQPKPKPKLKPEPKPEPKPELKPELKPEPEPEAEPELQPQPEPEPGPEPKPEPIPEPKPELKPEPKSEPELEPAEKRDEETAELLRLMGEDSSYFSKPAPKPREDARKAPPSKPAPKLPAAKPPISKPVEKKPVPQPSSGKPGLFAKFKAAWSPPPKKTIKAVLPAKQVPAVSPTELSVPVPKASVQPPSAKPTPVPAAAPALAPVPKPAKLQKPKRPGFFAQLFAPRKPAVKAAAPVPAPAAMAKPASVPIAKLPQPQKEVAPVIKKPVPAAKKPVPSIKPKREKPPRAPVDHLALWSPWGLALTGVVSSSFRDFGFEGLPAVLWGLAGWAIGFMVRLMRLYPFKPFEESRLNDLAVLNGPDGRRGHPVILRGQLVPLDELNPKSALIFKQDEKTLVINRLGRWDILPRLFGLSNPRQLPKGDVTIKGWYRPGPNPSLEVHDVRAEKLYRKSMTKSLRWAFAVSLLILVVVIDLALD